jgi:hypothetical protein
MGNGGDTGDLIMCEQPYSPMQYGSPKSSRVASWLDEQAWQLFGPPREVSKPWVSSLGTPGWAVQPWPSPVLLQTDSILLQIVPARARVSPVVSRSRHEDVCVEKKSVQHHVCLGHGMARRRSLTRRPTVCAG